VWEYCVSHNEKLNGLLILTSVCEQCATKY